MSARAAFGPVVGTTHVLEQRDPGFDGYADPYGFEEEPARAAAVVRPASVDEVRGVLAVARERRLALWPVSRGRNFSYGGAAPRVPGSVICDLSRMDRVLEVDEACGVAMVEPGCRSRRSTRICAPAARGSRCRCPTSRGAASSATRWSAASATPPTPSTRRRTAAWRSCSLTGTSSGPAWAPSRAHGPGATALCLLIFDRSDADQRARVDETVTAVIRATGAAGYGTYRSHVANMDVAAAQYADHDHAALRVTERLKDALDPVGVLAPGKQGVWPAGPRRDDARARAGVAVPVP